MTVKRKFVFLSSIAAVFALMAAAGGEVYAGWGSWGGSWGGSRGFASGGSTGSLGSWGSRGAGFHSGGSHGSSGGRAVLFPRVRNLFSGSHGSRGGAHGSFGSYGGSRGSHGSSGGTHYAYYGGSSGGFGSYGGSHGSHGGTGFYNSYGGGVAPLEQGMQGVPFYPSDGLTIPGPTEGMIPPTGPVDSNKPAVDEDGNSVGTADAILNVSLPIDAKVYVNGKLTRTQGEQRQFVSRALQAGRNYTYEVQAVLEGRGVMTRIVDLRAGESKTIDFDFDNRAEKITSVMVQVPENAKVVLAGNESMTRGPVRFFSTDSLQLGESWDNYTIEVTFDVNGESVTRAKTIAVVGGQSHDVSFMDEYERIASR